MLNGYKIVPMWRILKNREVRSFLEDKVKVKDKVKVLDDLNAGADAEALPFNEIEGVRVSIEGTLTLIHPDPGCECPQPATEGEATQGEPYIPFDNLFGESFLH